MRNNISLILFLILLYGCSSTYLVQGDNSENYINKINYLSKSYTAFVELTDGQGFYTKSMTIKNDSLYLYKDELEAISLELVSTIKLRDIVRGFFDGFWGGIGLASASIVVVGLASGSSNEPMGYGVLIIGGISFVATLVINSIFSGNKTFVFQRNFDNSFTQLK